MLIRGKLNFNSCNTEIFFILFDKIIHGSSDINFYNVCMHMHRIYSYYKMNIIFMTG